MCAYKYTSTVINKEVIETRKSRLSQIHCNTLIVLRMTEELKAKEGMKDILPLQTLTDEIPVTGSGGKG